MKNLYWVAFALAASVVLVPPARAQDKTATHVGTTSATNAPASVPVSLYAEPKIVVGGDKEITGLFVDFLEPRQTWNLFNPAVPGPKPATVAYYAPPLSVCRPSTDDLTVHDAHFVLLSLHFR